MRHVFSVRVGPAAFRIGSDWRAPLAALERLYAGYPKPEGGIADFTVRLTAPRPWRRIVRPQVAIEGDFMLPDAVPLPLSQGLLAAEMGMNLQMALGWRRHLLLHAGVAEKEGRALILTGHSGSGKSTLAALLGERGWRFMGDEFALLGLGDGLLHPFPRAISLKNDGIAALEAVSDAARFGPRLAATPKGDVRHLTPNAAAREAMEQPARPAAILFPRFGHARDERPVEPGEAFMRLTQASTNYVALGEAGFDALAGLVEAVPARAIDYESGDEAVEAAERIWREAAA